MIPMMNDRGQSAKWWQKPEIVVMDVNTRCREDPQLLCRSGGSREATKRTHLRTAVANLPDTDTEEALRLAETKEASAEMKAAAETDVAEAAANNKDGG